MSKILLKSFAPPFKKDTYSPKEKQSLLPFFTNLTDSVYAPLIFSPEVIGALCSRTSRAADDLRKIFLNEYINPFLEKSTPSSSPPHVRGRDSGGDSVRDYGKHLSEFIKFLHKHPLTEIFSNPRARSFYAKWLAQYGDDSIAQMAGMHLVFASLSQIGIKHFEDQRIGLAPIEKSTRYVNYASKIKGHYRYYTDPTLKKHGLTSEYRSVMDNLFKTYITLLPKLQNALQNQFPEEKPNVVEKKAFDTLRGLLPMATLSQVAFFGNGQAFEYAVARSLKSPLGEIRWAGERAYEELYKIAPSFLRRLKDPEGLAAAEHYQDYLAMKNQRVTTELKSSRRLLPKGLESSDTVKLLEYDPLGQEKVIAGILYGVSQNKLSWEKTLAAVKKMKKAQKEKILEQYLSGRTQRWQKVGRAFENAYVRYEIVMNIGAWRDLHRHRIQTQQRQFFTTELGYDLPPELIQTKLDKPFVQAMNKVDRLYRKIAKKDPMLAQYVVTLAHRVRFQQWKNLRQCFWELELRTIPEGHPDYRKIEQEKFKLLEKVYPLITQHMRVNMGDYDFARRGQEEKIQAKLKELERLNG